MSVARQVGVPKYRKALLAYRIMAFATGVALLVASLGLLVQVTGNEGIKTGVGLLWLCHGYLYLMYLLATANLGLKMRWGLIRIVLVSACGTIPTMSFVAEHFVTRYVRAQVAERQAPAGIDTPALGDAAAAID